MPELPEVETVRRYLDLHLPGSVVEATTLRRPDLRYPIPQAEVTALAGGELGAVERRAKYLLVPVAAAGQPERAVLVHLGMTGRLFVDEAGEAEPEWRTHEHWRFLLRKPDRSRQWLRYVDARRFGALDVLTGAPLDRHPLLASLGPEPLGDAFTPAVLAAAAAGKRVAIKLLIMDGKIVVGVGNIYANEALFRAGIVPQRPAGALSAAELERLVQCIREVLAEAIAQGGSTLRDFVSGDESPGYFQQRLAVYDRAGEPCVRCGQIVERGVLGQRATFWCAGCQR